MITRKCCICRSEFTPNAGHPRHLCGDPECDKKKRKLRTQGIYKYSCLTCNKVVTLSYSKQKSCYCSNACKSQADVTPPPPPPPLLQIDKSSDFPEQPLIQHVYNRMLAAKAPRSEDVDELCDQLVKLYPEDHKTLYTISYRLPLDAVLKIAAYYGTQL